MFNIKELFLIDVLEVIPGETQDEPLRMRSIWPKSIRLPLISSLVTFTILFQVKVKR